MPLRFAFVFALFALLSACSNAPPRGLASPSSPSTPISAPPASPAQPSTRYYKDDGPGENPPDNLEAIADAIPRPEPLHRYANRPYTVLGRDYVPATALRRYRERGIASWYGRKFHGEKTSTGETYDMYKMTAAHPTLPLPCYARVTNVNTGKSVVVRVNDRGPFLHDRIIDLSYAAANKLGIAQSGSGLVEVEAIVPADLLLADASPPLSPVTVTEASAPSLAPDIPLSVAPGGFAVQLGAFANYANAQNFLAHVQNQLASVPVEAKVRQVGGLFRVYVGPYPDREEARRIADRLKNAFGFAAMVAPH
ncbi:MAG: septal ring lytic transglycosylase RlpA family protein [Betaproteobacteria bacterium]|nr:MAG: septal ring lytic transglycosylase RlpA family protein [Betaproteobacteria bacterium]